MPIDILKMQDCEHVLTNFGPPNVAQFLHEVADSKYAQLPADVYGKGGACDEVVDRLKVLFDKPAARFCVKGMVAQMALLRAVTEQTRNNRVVVHRLSHLDYDEMEAVEILHPIRFMRAGGHNRPFNVDDLDALGEKPAVVSVELPLRRAGYKLLPFAELQKIATWCHVHDVHLHIDGARIFGAAAAYGKSLSEVAALCDSLYCSFYKELKGIGGCGLVGTKAMMEATDVWVTRMGGNLPAQYPLSVTALMGLDHHLDKVKDYVVTAREIAKRFNAISGISTLPVVPHTSGFQVHLKGEKAKIEAALLYMVESEKVWISGGVSETAIEGVFSFDVEIGGRSLELPAERWAFHMDKLARKMRTE